MVEAIEEVIRRLSSTETTGLWRGTKPGKITLTGKSQRAYSTIYRLRVESAEEPSARIVYTKVYKLSPRHRDNPAKPRAKLKNEFETAQRLQAHLNGSQKYAVVKPIAYYLDLLTIVTEEAQGEPLANALESSCKLWHDSSKLEDVLVACRRAGEALAAIQRATAEPQKFNPVELLEYVDIRLQRLVEGEAPFSESNRKQVLKFLENAIAQVPGGQCGQCGCHGDYAPFNVLVGPAGVTVMDFATFKSGSLYNDVAYFHHRVEGYLHKPSFNIEAIRRVQNAFLAGYNRGTGREHDPIENDLLFKIFWIKHVINNYSAVMRKKVMTMRDRLSLAVYLFNRHVFRRYNQWLMQMCQD